MQVKTWSGTIKSVIDERLQYLQSKKVEKNLKKSFFLMMEWDIRQFHDE